MSDLISRSALIEAMRKKEEEYEKSMLSPSWWTAFNVIKEQPTAYDENAIIAYGTECYKKGREEWIEKIVGKLDNAESIKIFGSLNSGNRLIPVNDAINIVKAGGIDG